jgi:DNA-binding MarR family transcriptional regulator
MIKQILPSAIIPWAMPGDAMAADSPNPTALAQNWCALSLLHERIQAHLERALQDGHVLSVREFSLLTVLARQHEGEGGHLQMKQVADSVLLSQSATTRLVTRLEERGLLARCFCPIDRRGIYTNVTEAGHALLEQAQPTRDEALEQALDEARRDPHLLPLVKALDALEVVAGPGARRG